MLFTGTFHMSVFLLEVYFSDFFFQLNSREVLSIGELHGILDGERAAEAIGLCRPPWRRTSSVAVGSWLLFRSFSGTTSVKGRPLGSSKGTSSFLILGQYHPPSFGPSELPTLF